MKMNRAERRRNEKAMEKDPYWNLRETLKTETGVEIDLSK